MNVTLDELHIGDLWYDGVCYGREGSGYRECHGNNEHLNQKLNSVAMCYYLQWDKRQSKRRRLHICASKVDRANKL